MISHARGVRHRAIESPAATSAAASILSSGTINVGGRAGLGIAHLGRGNHPRNPPPSPFGQGGASALMPGAAATSDRPDTIAKGEAAWASPQMAPAGNTRVQAQPAPWHGDGIASSPCQQRQRGQQGAIGTCGTGTSPRRGAAERFINE